jgi:prolyl-tRNA synthetase
MIAVAKDKPGFIRAMWCGELECELKLKEVAEVSSRCMPFGEEGFGETCVCCGKPAKHLVYWGKAY